MTTKAKEKKYWVDSNPQLALHFFPSLRLRPLGHSSLPYCDAFVLFLERSLLYLVMEALGVLDFSRYLIFSLFFMKY